MKSFIGALVVFLLLQAPPPTSVVSGTLKLKDLDQPIPGVTVKLNRSRSLQTQDLRAVVGSDGRFSFSGVLPGDYEIVIQEPFYIRPPKKSGPLSITVAAGKDVKDLELFLVKAGSLRGQITDSERRPVAGAQIQIYTIAYRNGRRMLTLAGSQATMPTNQNGEYQTRALQPGEYYVRALVAPSGSTGRGGTTVPFAPDVTNSSVYYPGTSDATTAAPIVVHSGDDIRGMDFVLPTNRQSAGVTVSGTFDNGGLLRSAYRPTNFALVPRDSGKLYANYYNAFTNLSAAPGRFELRGVQPGNYDLFVVIAPNLFKGPASGALYGRTPISVGTRDVDNVQVVLPPNVDVFGEMEIKGDASKVRWSSLKIDFNVDYLVSPLTTVVTNTGAFMQVQMSPYFYRPVIMGLPESTYVEDILQSGGSIYDRGIDAARDSSKLRVILNTNGGTIRGVVNNADNSKIVRDVTVVLVPQVHRRQNLALYKVATSATDGSFEIKGVPPGEWKLFGWAEIPEFAYQNAEFLAAYESRGQVVVLSAGASADVQLKVIP
jgi:hypothetical protein